MCICLYMHTSRTGSRTLRPLELPQVSLVGYDTLFLQVCDEGFLSVSLIITEMWVEFLDLK